MRPLAALLLALLALPLLAWLLAVACDRQHRWKYNARLVWRAIRSCLFVVAILGLAGCPGRGPRPDPAPATPVGEQADAARATERGAITARDSQQMASLDALLARVPDLSKEGWESELGIMRARYGTAKPSAADAGAARARVDAWADGRTAEAQALAAQALATATEQARLRAKAEAERIAAEAREAASRQESDQRIRELEADLEKEKENFTKSVRKWIVAGLYIAAVVCVGLAVLRFKAALTTGLAPLAAAKTGGFLLGAAGSCVSLAKLVGAWWFEWACYVVAAGIVGWIGWTVWREQRLEQAKRAAKAVVKRLDDLYDHAVDDRKELDAIIFDPLSQDMKAIAGAKEAIHLLRAEEKVKAA